MPVYLAYVGLGTGALAFGFLLGFVSSRADPLGTGDGSLGRGMVHVGVFTAAVPAQLWLGFWGVVLYGSVILLLRVLGFLRATAPVLLRGLARADGMGKPGRGALIPMAATALGGVVGALLVGPFAIVGYLVCGWGEGLKKLRGGALGRRTQGGAWEGLGEGASHWLGASGAILASGSVGGWAALALLGTPFLSAVAVGCLAGLVGAISEGVSPGRWTTLWGQLLPSLSAWWILG